MTDFYSDVVKLEKHIKIHGYDKQAEREFAKRWRSL